MKTVEPSLYSIQARTHRELLMPQLVKTYSLPSTRLRHESILHVSTSSRKRRIRSPDRVDPTHTKLQTPITPAIPVLRPTTYMPQHTTCMRNEKKPDSIGRGGAFQQGAGRRRLPCNRSSSSVCDRWSVLNARFRLPLRPNRALVLPVN